MYIKTADRGILYSSLCLLPVLAWLVKEDWFYAYIFSERNRTVSSSFNSPWTTQHPVFILLSLLLIIATNEVESASYNICLRTRESGALLE